MSQKGGTTATCAQTHRNSSSSSGDDGRSVQARRRNDPTNYFVFIVGVCAEWENGRDTVGDTALYNAHKAAGVPEDQIVFLKDDDANVVNCLDSFSKLLERTFESSTLIFYYGGRYFRGFGTPGCTFEYGVLIEEIERWFQGDRVILLADCCASGNLCHEIDDPPSMRHNYVAIASTQPHMEAGAAWCITTCWINLLKKNYCQVSLSQIIAYMADETARTKGDCLASFCRGKEAHAEDCTWLPQCSPGKTALQFKWNHPMKKLRD